MKPPPLLLALPALALSQDDFGLGDRTAYVSDCFGNRLAEIRAPVRGVVLVIYDTPPVSKDEEAIAWPQGGRA
jgi:hypothetical protein